MYITDTWPTRVNGFVMPYAKDDPSHARTVRLHAAASMIALRMDNGAVSKLLQVDLRGHGVWARIHGARGQMENLRHGDTQMVRLRREQYHERRTDPVGQVHLPDCPAHASQARWAGHGQSGNAIPLGMILYSRERSVIRVNDQYRTGSVSAGYLRAPPMSRSSTTTRKDHAMTRLSPVTQGESLREEFLVPMVLSQYRLAKEIGVPAQRISGITAGKRAITADTDLRLCKYFGLSNGYRLRARAAHDTEVAEERLSEALSQIRPWSKAEAPTGRPT